MKITVLGGGSWATALVKILSENNVKIKWWIRNKESVEHIRKFHHNPDYLSSIELHPSKVKPYHVLKEALKDTDWVILAIPAAFLEEVFMNLPQDILDNKYIVSGVKGMIPSQNCLVTDWLQTNFLVPKENLLAIGGPCHAEEIALEKHSYLTISGYSSLLAKTFSEALRCRYVGTSFNTDIEGVEYAAIIKNIIALACGISQGLGSGDNFQAVMVANGIEEIHRFVDSISPHPRQINSSAYLGDLLVTTYSQFSRNRTFGKMIGKGYTIQSAQVELKMIAEGYFATKSVYELNLKYAIEMPILNFVYTILYQNKNLHLAFADLKKHLN
ncbi:MAG: NAD(P)H-dependent glycerol-3-phosphate dehydrogenase [Leadbetterella sp.]